MNVRSQFWCRARSQGPRLAGWGVAGILLVLSTWQMPVAPEGGLDATWQLLLSRALLDGWRLGHDVLFTYGPLGALENHVQLSGLFWAQVAWQLVSRLAIALLVLRFLSRLPTGFACAAGAAIGVLYTAHRGYHPPDPYLLLGIFLAGWTLLERPGGTWAGLAVMTLAALACVKFTLFMAAALAIGLVVATELLRRVAAAALVAAGGASLAAAIWRLAGQGWSDWPGYLRGSWAVADGYIDAMQLRNGWSLLALMAAFCAGALVVLWRTARTAGGWREATPRFLLGAGCLYLAWRHGTVRGDEAHFWGTLAATATWPWLLLAMRPVRTTSFALEPRVVSALTLASVAALAIFGQGADKPRHCARNLQENAAFLLGVRDAGALWTERAEAAVADLLKNEEPINGMQTAYALDAAFLALAPDARPLPNLQPYSAYTADLAGRDLRWLMERAPLRIRVDMRAIDDRVAGAEHARLLLYLAKNYTWMAEGGGSAILERRKGPGAGSTGEIVASARALRFGETIVVPQERGPVLLVAKLEPTPAARLIRWFLPLPSLKLRVERESSPVEEYRLTWRLAKQGIALRPFLATNADLRRWMTAGKAGDVVRVSIQGMAARWLYKEPFAIEFLTEAAGETAAPAPPAAPGGDRH